MQYLLLKLQRLVIPNPPPTVCFLASGLILYYCTLVKETAYTSLGTVSRLLVLSIMTTTFSPEKSNCIIEVISA